MSNPNRILQEEQSYGFQAAQSDLKRDSKGVIHLNADATGRGMLWDPPQVHGFPEHQSVSLELDALKLQKQVLDSLGFVDCDVERVYSEQEMSLHGHVPHASYPSRHLQGPIEAVNNKGFTYQHAYMGSSSAQCNSFPSHQESGALLQDDWPLLTPLIKPSTQVTDVNVEAMEECLVGLEGEYQSYCNQIITPRLNEATIVALTRLKNMQIAMDASSGQSKGSLVKKYYCSLKEVSKVARTCKLLIIAPDVKPSPTAHIKPVRMLLSVIEDAAHAGVPYIFALSRKGIGQIFGKDKNMSIMALMSLDQIEEECAIMIKEATYGRTMYQSCRNNFFHPIIRN